MQSQYVSKSMLQGQFHELVHLLHESLPLRVLREVGMLQQTVEPELCVLNPCFSLNRKSQTLALNPKPS